MKLGTSNPVSRRKTPNDSPWFTTSSTKRNDWVSQISAVNPLVTAIRANKSWRKM